MNFFSYRLKKTNMPTLVLVFNIDCKILVICNKARKKSIKCGKEEIKLFPFAAEYECLQK